jgi:hypothetical protein
MSVLHGVYCLLSTVFAALFQCFVVQITCTNCPAGWACTTDGILTACLPGTCCAYYHHYCHCLRYCLHYCWPCYAHCVLACRALVNTSLYCTELNMVDDGVLNTVSASTCTLCRHKVDRQPSDMYYVCCWLLLSQYYCQHSDCLYCRLVLSELLFLLLLLHFTATMIISAFATTSLLLLVRSLPLTLVVLRSAQPRRL